MLKLLIIISSISLGTVPTLNLTATNMTLKKEIFKPLNGSQSDLDKISNWHNTLTIAQDKIAKADYLDAMDITTVKKSDFDNYNIGFDNSKLQTMLKKGIINQDVYNIWSNQDSSTRLSKEANAIVTLPNTTNTNTSKKARAFQSYFYIKNNKMYFINKIKKPSTSLITIPALQMLVLWQDSGIIDIEQSNYFVRTLDALENNDVSEEVVDRFFMKIIQEIISYAPEGFEDLIWILEAAGLYNDQKPKSKYTILNGMIENLPKLTSESNKYHSSTEESFYLEKNWLDPASIEAVPPINEYSKITDKDNHNILDKGEVITHEYDFDTLISYSNYDSLWEFLNSNVTFNLGKKFESSIGILKKYKSYNTTFDKNESSNILKPYLNNWVQLTEVDWRNENQEQSKAEMDLEISDNPWNKTIYFNFKSTLCNMNTFDSVENWMY